MYHEWFNKQGELIKQIPQAAVNDCSGSGDVSNPVTDWVTELKFIVPPVKAKSYLRSTGAWEDTELNKMTVRDLSERVLWLICCDLSEGKDYIILEG